MNYANTISCLGFGLIFLFAISLFIALPLFAYGEPSKTATRWFITLAVLALLLGALMVGFGLDLNDANES